MPDYLRLESGDKLLLESGDAVLLESSVRVIGTVQWLSLRLTRRYDDERLRRG